MFLTKLKSLHKTNLRCISSNPQQIAIGLESSIKLQIKLTEIMHFLLKDARHRNRNTKGDPLRVNHRAFEIVLINPLSLGFHSKIAFLFGFSFVFRCLTGSHRPVFCFVHYKINKFLR